MWGDLGGGCLASVRRVGGRSALLECSLELLDCWKSEKANEKEKTKERRRKQPRERLRRLQRNIRDRKISIRRKKNEEKDKKKK